ncbi:hypothetical protein VTN00DRAFT_2531 [Thermoascus crustaceus]|uniref:uncharacterized protein n=1 Tax=Thermoascus crustaceus TaxID=5088 RepID=UPI0037421AE4
MDMDATASAIAHANDLYARMGGSSGGGGAGRPPVYKAIGISLAVASGFFIGVSFVLKKVGLLKANVKYNEEAGEGYGYLKNFWWWSGMILMIIGEICNFVAYAFVDAILVTPLGALSVVITTILSAIFLKERLSFVGKVGCFSCIVGSVVIAMNAPQQSSVDDIQAMKHYVIAPGFLTYGGVIIVGCTFVALWAGPRYGKKTMFVYLSICSLIGGLSVVATQGLGAAILAQIRGEPQYKEWFLYVLFVFVVGTLLTEIIYLNKALNIFNAALVTPTYYVFFTSATIVTSAVLFRGFKGTGIQIATVIMGFLQICAGVVLLQLSKSAKDVPDAAIFKGDLDQIREVGEQEQPESEPKADAIRGTAAIIRRISTPRQKMEAEEARRYFRERQEDLLKPPGENEIIEWDGLRRRKTVIGEGPTTAPRTPGSAKTVHPPLGMSRFPDEEGEEPSKSPGMRQTGRSLRRVLRPSSWGAHHDEQDSRSPMHPVALTNITFNGKDADTAYRGAGRDALAAPFDPKERSDTPRSIAWADEARDGNHLTPEPPHSARRQFSFSSVFSRRKSAEPLTKSPASPGRGILRRSHIGDGAQRRAVKNATEEERLGLVKGDSRMMDEEDLLNEKLQRTLSSSSESSLEDLHQPVQGQTQGQYSRPHQGSISSDSSTDYPPPYGGTHPNVENLFIHPPSRQVSSPSENDDEVDDGWQIPRTRSPPQPPATAVHPNPVPRILPPLPPESPALGDSAADSYTRVELHSPDHERHHSFSGSGSDLGVASLSSTSSSADRRDGDRNHRRRDSGWRRPERRRGGDGRGRRVRGESASSGSGSGAGSRGREERAFI